VARKTVDRNGPRFGRSRVGVEVNEALYHPMQIIDGCGKCCVGGVRTHITSPPRRRHNDSKEAMLSRDVQPSPILVDGIIVGVRPRLNGPPLWLATNPPDDPFPVELLNVGDRGWGVTLASPVDNFLGSRLQGQPSWTLGHRLVNNRGWWVGITTYPQGILGLELQIVRHRLYPS